MELFIDPGDHRSLTVQLYDQLREAIADGRLPPGARLQPSRAVAEKLAIARSTVTDAYARLTAEGFVEGRRGGGSIVTGGACVEPSPAATPTALTPRPEAAAIRRYGSDLTAPARYDLTAGRVDARLFPLADWRRCTNRALAGLGDQYGSYSDPTGSPELRQALARWVAQSRGVAATPEQIVVTHGAAHAVDLLARVLLRPRRGRRGRGARLPAGGQPVAHPGLPGGRRPGRRARPGRRRAARARDWSTSRPRTSTRSGSC